MRIVELFAGIGGFRLGFGEEHDYVFASDMHPDAQLIYKVRFGHDLDSRKIQEVHVDEIPDHDLLCGGFPCATFSIAGKREGLTKEHDKGMLFYEITRILTGKMPKYVMLENVGGLLTHDSGRTFSVILWELGRLGYSVQWQKFNSRNFGTPQNRERVFIVGILGETRQVLPIIPTTQTDFAGTVLTQRSGKVRTYKEGTFPCLTALMGTGGNNVPVIRDADGALRKITPEEAERLQGLPVGHTEGLPLSARYERIGRSLNPAIPREIMRLLLISVAVPPPTRENCLCKECAQPVQGELFA
jgi:DNA (cytosine-5)-methyltransferase 1